MTTEFFHADPDGFADPMAFIERARTFQKEADRILHDHLPPLIGIGGYMTAGKDAAADHLVANHGFVKLGMSDALAEALYALNPLIPSVSFPDLDTMRYRDHLDAVGYTAAKRHPEVRRLLQVLGTEVGRDIISRSVWIDIVTRRIIARREQGQPVIVTGMRFQNELTAITRLGGDLVWVDRPGVIAPDTSHASEGSVGPQDFEYTLNNTGTLSELGVFTDTLLTVLKQRASA